ncbi:hypothetical protein FA15DRAFT_674778 [Coprinopsis marcescibilis]|uniref:MARVEL domain-containing protein n=1 Tax=Coprinopsis marcescibilis TaxID=230819 RepID=A0A5C3KH65_COPMA|nr:hypothetical protein FA15DRAFT_674778 [Coprinopsis marcescibilis]
MAPEPRNVEALNAVLSIFIVGFGIASLVDASWLLSRYAQGDTLASPTLVPFGIYIMVSSGWTIAVFVGLWWRNPVKALVGRTLWLFLVSSAMWLASAIGLTVLYQGSYSCISVTHLPINLGFDHCHQHVALQAFCWVQVCLFIILGLNNEENIRFRDQGSRP